MAEGRERRRAARPGDAVTLRRRDLLDTNIGGLWSAIGAVTSAVYLSFLPFRPVGMALAIFVTVLLCLVVKIPGHASLDPRLNPGLNALLRLAELCIGTAMAIMVSLLWPERNDAES